MGVSNHDPDYNKPIPTYIGTKIVKAYPMTKEFFNASQGRSFEIDLSPDALATPGYYVEYEDGYKSWSPKDVFEQCYREITPGEAALLR